MPRLSFIVLVLMVSMMCRPGDPSTAQEATQTCPACPAKCSESSQFAFEIPGIDFPLAIRVDFESNQTPKKPTCLEDCAETACDGSKHSGIPFLNCQACKLFTNVGLATQSFCDVDSDVGCCEGTCCAEAKSNCGTQTCCADSNTSCCKESCGTDSKTNCCAGSCCALTDKGSPNSCKDCQPTTSCQASSCEDCDRCPAVKMGVPIVGFDRLFTTSTGTPSITYQMSDQKPQCQSCKECPGDCPSNTIQTNSDPGCQQHTAGIELAGYVAMSNPNAHLPRYELSEEMFELRIENERLKMEVEIANTRVEMMEAMMEMREENAVLRTQIEFLKVSSRLPREIDRPIATGQIMLRATKTPTVLNQ